jgi:hypothetical protein
MKFISDVRERFSGRFLKAGRTDNAIRALVNKLKKKWICARESVESVRQVFEEEQKLSVWNASGRQNTTTTTVNGALRSTLKKKPYHIQMLHDLPEDYPIRAAAECVCVRV